MSEIKYHKIKITVDSVRGTCPLGSKPGKVFIIGRTTPAGMCISAFNAVGPVVQVLRYGGSFSWEKDANVAFVGCPDHINQVVYKVQRASEMGGDSSIYKKIDEELEKIAKSYHPIASYHLMCAIFKIRPETPSAVRFLGCYTLEMAHFIEGVLGTLMPKEEAVIKYRFGLMDSNGDGQTLQMIGRLYGLTRERIRQIETKALQKLRIPARSRALKVLCGLDMEL